MKLGISTHIFAFGKLDESHLDLILESGFKNIEMWGMRPHVDWYNPKRVKELARHIENIGLNVATFHLPFYNIFGAPEFRWIAFRNPDPQIRKEAMEMSCHIVDLCPQFGCDTVILHGNGTLGPDFDGDDKRYREGLDQFLLYCQDRGVRIAIENIMTKLSDTGTLRELVDEYDNDHLWLCLDTGHANIAEDVPSAIKNCGKRLLTTHIADNFGKRDDHLVPFRGIINWEETFSLFKAKCPNLENFIFELIYPVMDIKNTAEVYRKDILDAKKVWERLSKKPL